MDENKVTLILGSIIVIGICTIVCFINHNCTEVDKEYIRNGYTMKALPGIAYAEWVKGD